MAIEVLKFFSKFGDTSKIGEINNPILEDFREPLIQYISFLE